MADIATEKKQTDLDKGYFYVKQGELPASYRNCGGGMCYHALDTNEAGMGTVRLTTEQAEELGQHTGIKFKLKLSENGVAGKAPISGTLKKVKTQYGHSYMPENGDKTIEWLHLDDAPDLVSYELEVWAL